ncbi:hypothetical protein [Alkalibaculum sporogenes]|nr:hypothetical protein [Alkalibaculum sporogenes]
MYILYNIEAVTLRDEMEGSYLIGNFHGVCPDHESGDSTKGILL